MELIDRNPFAKMRCGRGHPERRRPSRTASKSAAGIRKPGRPAAVPVVADGITLDDIRVVKEVVNKIGADKVRQLAAVLGD
jgi:hypothetical protein